MKKKNWVMVNAENIVPFVCDDVYSSKLLTGDEMAGMPIININEGTLKGRSRTHGAAHEETEIYYIIEGSGIVWLDEDAIPVKPGDIIVIPPQVFHWIDNTMNEAPFKLFTFWPNQEQNIVYFSRKDAWGTSMKYVDDAYVQKRLESQLK